MLKNEHNLNEIVQILETWRQQLNLELVDSLIFCAIDESNKIIHFFM